MCCREAEGFERGMKEAPFNLDHEGKIELSSARPSTFFEILARRRGLSLVLQIGSSFRTTPRATFFQIISEIKGIRKGIEMRQNAGDNSS